MGYPAQAWAHTTGLVRLAPNRPCSLAEIADRLAIQDVFARFGIAYDEGAQDVLRSLFTEDARLEVTEGRSSPHVSRSGREDIVVQMSAVFAYQADQRRHVITNLTFESLQADTAVCIAYGVVTIANDGLSLGATVIYSADLARGPDGLWRFSRLLIGMDGYAGQKPPADERT